MNDYEKCPTCGGPADNGNDRCVPPNAYECSKCEAESQKPPQGEGSAAVMDKKPTQTADIQNIPEK